MKAPALRLDQLQIDGFGHFHELQVELGPKLNVLYGENGVGKSTLMAFVRSVLFGFARRNTPERYQTHGGKAFGGRVLLSTPHGELWVQRLDGKRAEGDLTVKNGVMAAVPESRLREALASVDRELFEQVFAFGLDELRSWGQLMDAGKVKDALAAASMQGALRLPHALEQLDAQARAVWGRQATTRPLNVVLHELALVRARRQQLGDRPREYFASRAQLDDAVVEAERLQRAIEAVKNEEFLLEKLRDAAPHVERAIEARTLLLGLPDLVDFPEDGLVRLDEALRAEQGAAAAHARAAVNAQSFERRLSVVGASIAGRCDPASVAAAVDGWRQVASVDAALDERRASGEARARRLADQVRRLGLGTAIDAVDASAAARGALSALRARCDSAAEGRDRAVEAARLAGERFDEATRAFAALQADLQLHGAGASVEDALQASRALGNVEHEARVVSAQLEDRQTALAAAAVPGEPPPLERWPLWWVAAVFGVLLTGSAAVILLAGAGPGLAVSGVSLVAAGLLLTVHFKDHAHWLSARSAHLAVLRHRADHRVRLEAELAAARSRLLALDARSAALRATAQLAGSEPVGPRLAELERLAGAVARRAELLRDAALGEARLQAAAAEVARLREAARVATASASAEQQTRASLLARLGLPAALEPAAALEILTEVAVAQDLARTIADQAAALDRDASRVAEAGQALERAAQRAQVAGSSAAQLVSALQGWLETSASLQAESASVASRLEDATATLAAAVADLRHANARVRQLLTGAQADDVESFRRRGAAFARRVALAQDALHAEGRAKAVSGLSVDEAHAGLLVAPGLEQRLEAARAQRLALEDARRAAHEQRGALGEKLKAWEADAQLGQLLQQEQQLAAKAEGLAQRYAVARLGQAVLGQAREKFEAEHQPQVVQRAGQLFARLTAGRYPRLAVDAGNTTLQTMDSQGRAYTVEQLSRGTREQLLTSLRLAMIEDFGRDRLALPVLVDDVMVNFDPRRAEAMVEVLSELSEKHQVLAFTCHPQTRELFKEYGAKATEVSTRAQLALLPS